MRARSWSSGPSIGSHGAGITRASPTTRGFTLRARRSRNRQVPAPGVVQGYLRACRRCGAEFGMCRPCDRGRQYCNADCSRAARAEWIHIHRAAQRVTFKGRRARAARNRRSRRKKAAEKETDQSLPQSAEVGQGDCAKPIDGLSLELHENGPDIEAAELVHDQAEVGTRVGAVDEPVEVATDAIAGPVASPPLRCVRCRCIIDRILREDHVSRRERQGPGLARAGPFFARRRRGHG